MVNTFVNPVLNPEARLGVGPFDEAESTLLWNSDSDGNLEVVIRAVYKQVLGNAHVMESERLTTAESQLRQGNISVREFVQRIAKSDLYRSRFFEPCSPNRFIELNFKHLLGRAPTGYEEIADHIHLLSEKGYDAEIDSYLLSEEYDQVFGENTVPYYRGHKTLTGQKLTGFTHMFQLLRGAGSSDKENNHARLNRAMSNSASPIKPVSGPLYPWQALGILQKAPAVASPAPAAPWLKLDRYGNPIVLKASRALLPEQAQYAENYQPFRDADPVELIPGASPEGIDIVIRAVYRQVLGNAYVMESERLVVPESQLRRGEISVREFIRQIAKAELYRSRFFENCYWYRTIELNFKHLLGRAPQSFEEVKAHSATLDQFGYEADIDSYLDSDEYQDTFGENIVPYYRGHRTQPGQNMLEFTNMLQLVKSASSSDKDLTGGNAPRVAKAIILNSPYGRNVPRDAKQILAEVFKSDEATPTRSTLSGLSDIEQSWARQLDEKAVLIRGLRDQLDEQTAEINRLKEELAATRGETTDTSEGNGWTNWNQKKWLQPSLR
jgi:phycobilisome core-membrane linker protein